MSGPQQLGMRWLCEGYTYCKGDMCGIGGSTGLSFAPLMAVVACSLLPYQVGCIVLAPHSCSAGVTVCHVHVKFWNGASIEYFRQHVSVIYTLHILHGK